MGVLFSSAAVSILLLDVANFFVASSLLFLTGIIIYRRHFHPLAKYPGPFFASITDWYTVYHCLIGDHHLILHRLHQKYGSTVRTGPNRVSVNTNTALRQIYSVNANVQKSQIYSTYKHFFDVPMSMTMIDRRKHAFKRRINFRALTDQAIKEMEHLMVKNIHLMCQQIQEDIDEQEDGWSSSIDITKLISYAMSDIMGEMVFSKNWNVLRSPENRAILEFLPHGVAGVNITGYMPGLLKFNIYKLVARKLVNDVYRFKALAKAQSDWRIAHNNDIKRKDLFASLMEARDPETNLGFTEEEIVSEAGLLIIAGSDTMGTTVVATIFYLLHNLECLVRVQDEVRRTFNEVEGICMGTQLSSCHFLFACITETMRFTPPVGACLPREVLKGGIVIDGEPFPEGIDISVPMYGLHHNEKYFPDSFSYKPDRWIVTAASEGVSGVTEAEVELAQSAHHPFGVGRSSCVGRHLAYQEMAIMLARIMWLYEIRLGSPSTIGEGDSKLGELRKRKEQFQTWDKFVSTHEGPMVQFKPRKRE